MYKYPGKPKLVGIVEKSCRKLMKQNGKAGNAENMCRLKIIKCTVTRYFNFLPLFRDTFIYASSADRRGMDSVVRVLGEVILRPQISLKEVNQEY